LRNVDREEGATVGLARREIPRPRRHPVAAHESEHRGIRVRSLHALQMVEEQVVELRNAQRLLDGR
jgi:hypothetical protein